METLKDNKYFTEEIINIRYSDIDFNKRLKMNSLLNFMQDIANDNAEKNGAGISFIRQKNLMWVLLKYRIEFLEYPADINTFKLVTAPRGYNKFFAHRNFEIYNNSGNKLTGKASTVWTLVDLSTMNMVNVENIFADVPSMVRFVQDKTDLKYDKIRALTDADYEEEFRVLYNDIDINMHANNSNYIIWALEPLPYEYKNKHTLKNIDIVYKKEIKYGEKFISQVKISDNNTTVHSLKNSITDEDFCMFKCEWA